jgi:hypothetical protein
LLQSALTWLRLPQHVQVAFVPADGKVLLLLLLLLRPFLHPDARCPVMLHLRQTLSR